MSLEKKVEKLEKTLSALTAVFGDDLSNAKFSTTAVGDHIYIYVPRKGGDLDVYQYATKTGTAMWHGRVQVSRGE